MRAAILVVAVVACGPSAAPRPVAVDPAPQPDVAAAPIALDLSRPVRRIRVVGFGPRTELARAAIGTRVGDVIAPAQLRRDQLSLWELGGLAGLEVVAIAAEDGIDLELRATPRPRIRTVTVTGASQPQLVDAEHELGLVARSRFDPLAVKRARDRLDQAYEDAGFVFAEVAWSIADAPDDQIDLAVSVTEGSRVAIGSIAFRGNQRLTTTQLRAAISKAGAAVGEPYVPYAFDDGLAYLDAAYYEVGHVMIETGPAEVTFDADRLVADVVIPVSEGAQYKVGKVSFRGNLVETEARYRKLLGVKKGDVFRRSKVQAGLDAIGPGVTPLTYPDAVKHTIDLIIEIP